MSDAVRVDIRSLEDLREVLEGSDFRTAMVVLDAIGNNPEATLAYRSEDGQDVIDLLFSIAQRAGGGGVWLTAVRTLTSFDDPRVVEAMVGLLLTQDEPKVLAIAEIRLAQEPLEAQRGVLSCLTLQNQSVARARSAASLLACLDGLTVAENLRLSLLAERDEWETPACDESTLALWLGELAGPYVNEARQELEVQGEPAAALIAACWEDLSEENREWLVRWTSRARFEIAADLLRRALESGSEPLARTALLSLPAWEGPVESLRGVLLPWRTHADPNLRLAALRADGEGVDWRELFSRENDRAIRSECVTRLAQTEGAHALPDLLGYLESDEWEVRAAARDGLISIGEPAREPVRQRVSHPTHEVRVAAAQVLVGLDDDAWLQENVIEKKRKGA